MSWARYEGTAAAEVTLTGAARDAELEDFLRLQNPHLTDIRLEHATPTEASDAGTAPSRQWYSVTYLADDGQGHAGKG
ncbi:MAG TPA: hypothetical protein VMB04_00090 [Mycobacterium sp.]|nr:hypothetical protein [Mycobacterium sp.]